MQVRQDEWQVTHWPELLMTELLLQTQAPLTSEAPVLQVRHPLGVPLFVRQVSQVTWQVEQVPASDMVVPLSGHWHLPVLKTAVESQVRQLLK